MAGTRNPSEEGILRRAGASDGLEDRPIQGWTLDKLKILTAYTYKFSKACTQVGEWYYVDGFSGPGVNSMNGTRYLGSPLIAQTTEPKFSRLILMERSRKSHSALRARTAGDPRVHAIRGDVNVDLLPAMLEHLPKRWAPMLCLLDPEGVEVRWETVRAISRFRTGKTKGEIMILFNVDGQHRLASAYSATASDGESLTRMYGHDRWRRIQQRRERLELQADEARSEYLKLYASGFEQELGYRHVIYREILRGSAQGPIKYMLVFATDNEVGYAVVNHLFTHFFTEPKQMELFPEPGRLDQ